jgi:hypothetical protein
VLFDLRNGASSVLLALGPLLLPGAALAVALLTAYLHNHAHLSVSTRRVTGGWRGLLAAFVALCFVALLITSLSGPPQVDTSLGRIFLWNGGDLVAGLFGQGENDSANRDVWANIAAYLVLAGLIYLVSTRLIALLLPIAFSVAIEIVQFASPGAGRVAGAADLLSNTVGAVLGVITVLLALRFLASRRQDRGIGARPAS